MSDLPYETFLTTCSSSLGQKGYHILIKKLIFDSPFNKKLPVMIITSDELSDHQDKEGKSLPRTLMYTNNMSF